LQPVVVQSFDKIHFLFQTAPDELTMESDKDRMYRFALNIVKQEVDLSISDILFYLYDETDNANVKDVALQYFRLSPDDVNLVLLLSEVLEEQEFLKLLEPQLTRRPVLVSCHRAYQDAIKKSGKQSELVEQYQQLLAKEPANKDLIYLVARLLNADDHQQIRALLSKAVSQPEPQLQALAWLAKMELGCANFGQSLLYYMQLKHADNDFAVHENDFYQALLGQGDLRKAYQYIQQQAKDNSGEFSINDLQRLAYIQKLEGDSQGYQKTWESYRNMLKDWPENIRNLLMESLEKEMAYVSGDTEAYCKLYEADDDAYSKFDVFVINGNVDAAYKAIKDESFIADNFLLLYSLAKVQQKNDIADKALQAAIKQLSESETTDERVLAQMFAGQLQASVETLKHMYLNTDTRLTAMTAMGLKYPSLREDSFATAQKLNFNRNYPYLTIKQILESEAK
ncbi:MAG TPA: hypothetical protein DER01_12315, partial [Phycisphaerales bacterium]|nr:hypothetical protein [Phycisphaerales bacterium]